MGYAAMGYLLGHFPPGRRMVFRSARELLDGPVGGIVEAHRRVHALLKARDAGARVGVAHNVAFVEPLRPGRDDAPARRWDELMHWGFLDALVLGRQDRDLDGARETVTGEGSTLDFIGINYYTRIFVRAAPCVLPPLRAVPLYPEVPATAPRLAPIYRFLVRGRATLPRDEMGRELYADGLRRVLLEAARRYPSMPLIVTENGLAEARDERRGPELLAHLAAARAAIDAGARLEGFFYWSLFDNYEWGSFRPRFGLYRVDYEHGYRRTLTAGGAALREVIRENGGGGA
jgi:beta-glucosidase